MTVMCTYSTDTLKTQLQHVKLSYITQTTSLEIPDQHTCAHWFGSSRLPDNTKIILDITLVTSNSRSPEIRFNRQK